jgi:hypothetical protein
MKITNEDAVSIVMRLCPDDFAGGVARKLACEQIVSMDAEEWVNKPISEILLPIFEEAEKQSEVMVNSVCAVNSYGANNKELKHILNTAMNRAMIYSQVIAQISNAHEVARTYALLNNENNKD